MSSAVPGPKINYQGNSKLDKQIAAEETQKAEPKQLKKIEGVNVTQAKPTLGRKIRENFGGQNLKTVATAVLIEVIVPNAKDLLFDIIMEGGQRTIYGEGGRRRTGTSALASTIVGGASRMRSTNYSNISTQSRIVGSNAAPAQTTLSARERAMFDFTNLIFPDRAMAEEVLETMGDAISEYGMVTVADFYELIEQSGNGFTDQKFGWDARGFAGSRVVKVRDGFVLDLTTPQEVK